MGAGNAKLQKAFAKIDLEAGSTSEYDLQNLWERYDKDKSGALEKAEADQMLTDYVLAQHRASGSKRKLDKSEIEKTVATLWKLLDVDGDGTLTMAELMRKATFDGAATDGAASADKSPFPRWQKYWEAPCAEVTMVNQCEVSDDGETIYAATNDDNLVRFRRDEALGPLKGKVVGVIGTGIPINCIRLVRRGNRSILLVGYGRQGRNSLAVFKIIDLEGGALERVQLFEQAHDVVPGMNTLSGVQTITLLKDGKHILTTGYHDVKIWALGELVTDVSSTDDANSNILTLVKQVIPAEDDHVPYENRFVVSPDATRLYCALMSETDAHLAKIIEFNLERITEADFSFTPTRVVVSDLFWPGSVVKLGITPDASRLLAGCVPKFDDYDSKHRSPITVIHIESGKAERVLDTQKRFQTGLVLIRSATVVSMSAGGSADANDATASHSHPAAFAGGVGGMAIIDLARSRATQTETYHSSAVLDISLSSGAKFIASSGGDGKVVCYRQVAVVGGV